MHHVYILSHGPPRSGVNGARRNQLFSMCPCGDLGRYNAGHCCTREQALKVQNIAFVLDSYNLCQAFTAEEEREKYT